VKHLTATVTLAQLARARGDAALASEMVRELLPGGPQTTPGQVDLAPSLALIRIAADLCLERGDLVAAHAWLEAHDGRLAWSGAVLGQADGQLSWAAYYRVAGDLTRAGQHVRRALQLASEPRQPLALLATQRAMGELEAHAGRLAEARQLLDAARGLAVTCAAPYERALTLLAVADLELRAGRLDAAAGALDEVTAIAGPLGAVPVLEQAGVLAARLAEQQTAQDRTATAGLSPRELEVLRLLAAGRSNREIAELLYLSVRTVERHITNLYAKLGVHGRSEAIAFAHEHGFI
jgi:DNA-binding CsgD family transcriptional regulator